MSQSEIKIAFISPFVCRLNRGIERFTLDLAQSLVENWKGLDVSILTWKGRRSADMRRVGSSRLHILQAPYSRYFQSKVAAPFYLYHLLKGNFDIVNIFFAGYGEMSALLLTSLARKQKFNILLHYPYAQVPFRYQEFKKCNLISRADKIISASAFVADGLQEFCKKESTIIHNGFDEQLFAPAPEARNRIREELGFGQEDKVVLTVAALEERKGIQKIIEIMPLLRQEFPHVKYLVLGEGPYEQQLRQLVKQHALEQHVFLLGAKNDPVSYYRAADVFALLSYGEAAPLVILEAMGCGLAVVVSRQRPFDEIVDHNVAVVVNEDDPQEILESFTELMRNDTRRSHLGKAAREFVIERYSWSRVARQYYDLFCEQLSIHSQ